MEPIIIVAGAAILAVIVASMRFTQRVELHDLRRLERKLDAVVIDELDGARGR